MLKLFKFLFHKEKDVEGYIKAHVICNDHKNEFTANYTCTKEIKTIRCETCSRLIYYRPDGIVYDDIFHRVKIFSRSMSKFKPMGEL